jgi:hypothetical protein
LAAKTTQANHFIKQQGYRRQANGVAYEQPQFTPADAASQFENAPGGFMSGAGRSTLETVRIYPYGVARNRLTQAARRLGVPVLLANEAAQADVLVTLRSYFRKRQRTIVDAERRNMPIYVLRANTLNQMQQFLSDLFNLSTEGFGEREDERYLHETKAAIEAVLNGERWVELAPATASIRRLQHQMARQANLVSHSYGKEPRRRVRIFRESQ